MLAQKRSEDSNVPPHPIMPPLKLPYSIQPPEPNCSANIHGLPCVFLHRRTATLIDECPIAQQECEVDVERHIREPSLRRCAEHVVEFDVQDVVLRYTAQFVLQQRLKLLLLFADHAGDERAGRSGGCRRHCRDAWSASGDRELCMLKEGERVMWNLRMEKKRHVVNARLRGERESEEHKVDSNQPSQTRNIDPW